MRVFLIVSLSTNLVLAAGWYRTAGDYGRLLTWACANGNGGHECGED